MRIYREEIKIRSVIEGVSWSYPTDYILSSDAGAGTISVYNTPRVRFDIKNLNYTKVLNEAGNTFPDFASTVSYLTEVFSEINENCRCVTKLLAGETISAIKLLSIDPLTNNLVIATSSNEELSQVLGLSLSAGSASSTIDVMTFGEVEDASFSGFTAGNDLFLDASGNVTESPTTAGFHVRVGKALGNNKILIDIDEKIELC